VLAPQIQSRTARESETPRLPARDDGLEVDVLQPPGGTGLAAGEVEQVADEEAPQRLVLVEGPDHVLEAEPGRQLVHQRTRIEQQRRRHPRSSTGTDRATELVEVDDVVLVGLDIDVIPPPQRGPRRDTSNAGSMPVTDERQQPCS
jgi:hypothetical protein